MKPILLSLAMLTVSFAAHPSPNMDLLLDIICSYETQGHSTPKWAVGIDPGDWGWCQIRYESAWRYGGFDEQKRKTGVPSRSPGDLFDPRVSRRTGRNILKYCERKGYKTAVELAFCYKGGPHVRISQDSRHFPYARQIATTYAHEWLRRNGPTLKLAMR